MTTKLIKPIKTELDYQNTLKEIGAFFDNNPDTATQKQQDYYEVLCVLVEQYLSLPDEKKGYEKVAKASDLLLDEED